MSPTDAAGQAPPPELSERPPPWATNTRRLISIVKLEGPEVTSAVTVNLAGPAANGAVGAVYGERVPGALPRGVAEPAPATNNRRRLHCGLLLATLLAYGAIGVSAWCFVHPGVWRANTGGLSGGVWTTKPCNADGKTAPILAGVLIPVTLLITWYMSSKSSLYTLVHDVDGDDENDPDVARRVLAEMDAAQPSVTAQIECFHHEHRGSGKERRRVRVVTRVVTQELPVVACATVPGTELAPQWERLVRADVLGSVVSVDVGVDLSTSGSDVPLLHLLQRLAHEFGPLDAAFTLSWRVHSPHFVHKVTVSNGAPGPCAVAGYWLALLTLQGWAWSLCTERRVHRSDALLVKRLQLAPVLGPLGGGSAAATVVVMQANPMQPYYPAPPPGAPQLMLQPQPLGAPAQYQPQLQPQYPPQQLQPQYPPQQQPQQYYAAQAPFQQQQPQQPFYAPAPQPPYYAQTPAPG